MTPRAPSTCSYGACTAVATNGRRCPTHPYADRPGHNAAYGRQHRQRFHAAVIQRDRTCQWPAGCTEPATHADHYPLSRAAIVAQGLDPNDPAYGRGLCASHDSSQTASRQPGGWNRG